MAAAIPVNRAMTMQMITKHAVPIMGPRIPPPEYECVFLELGLKLGFFEKMSRSLALS